MKGRKTLLTFYFRYGRETDFNSCILKIAEKEKISISTEHILLQFALRCIQTLPGLQHLSLHMSVAGEVGGITCGGMWH